MKLYTVRWQEPSGAKASAEVLAARAGAALVWLLRLRPHIDAQTVVVYPTPHYQVRG